jgi:tetratricopeptide (TPR) repeat protein
VAIDRTKVLRQAEKLLRQGRLDAVIVEYERVLADFPHDWTTANALGDCYYRAHRADKAVEQYVRIALEQGVSVERKQISSISSEVLMRHCLSLRSPHYGFLRGFNLCVKIGQKNWPSTSCPNLVATALVSPLLLERLFFLSTYALAAHTLSHCLPS